jgi:mono/diheme cytochrome c family protein
MLTRYGSDPITVDVTISSLRGSETVALTRVLDTPKAAPDAITMLTGAVARTADSAAVQDLLTRATAATTAAATRMALLQGLDLGLPSAAGGRGGGRGAPGGGVPGAPPPAKPASLPGEPTALVKLSESADETGALAKRIVAKLEWPNKPVPVVNVPPLSADEQKRFAAGGDIYKSLCLGCHQPDGRGKEKMAPPLVESRYTNGPDSNAAIRILLAGKEGPVGLMPPLGGALKDDQIAAVLTYVRREWGNTGSPVAEDDVTEIRGLTKTRTKPWTDPELATTGRRGGGGRGQ